jgi:DNA-binding MarR family transcriptional regulator
VTDTDQTGSLATGAGADLGTLLRATFAQYKQEVSARLAEIGLSGLQARALQQLEHGEGLSTKQLATALGAEPSNLTAIVDRLEEAGLVERTVPTHDRRVKQLRLTPAGMAMRRRVESEVFAALTFFDRLAPVERHQLARLLAQLADPHCH